MGNEMYQVGLYGAIIYGALLTVCVYRTYRYWEVTGGKGDLKFGFHVLLLLNVALELVYFISFLIEERYSMWGYQVHLFSLLFHVLSYSVVLVLWAKALTVSNSGFNVLWRFILFLASSFGVATIVNSAYLFYTGNFDRYLNGEKEIYTSLWVVESFVLIVFTLWMVIYVLRVKKEVKSSMIQEGVADKDLIRSLWRINTVVAACIIAAVLRLLALCLIIVVSNFEFHELQWFIYSNWIPTVIPCIVLLFVTRPNPNTEEDDEEDGTQQIEYSTDGTSASGSRFYSDDESRRAMSSTEADPRSSRFSSHIDQEPVVSDDLLFSNKAFNFLIEANLHDGEDIRSSFNRSSRHSRKIEFRRSVDGEMNKKSSSEIVFQGQNPMFDTSAGDAL